MAPNCWTYFKLLMWKNYLITIRHKKELVIETAVPILFFGLILLLRDVFKPDFVNTPTTYDPEKIDTLDKYLFYMDVERKVAYTPDTDAFRAVVSEAAAAFNLTAQGFKNGYDMELHMLNNLTFCGVEFTTDGQSLPKNLGFRLRFPALLRTNGGNNPWPTDKLFPRKMNQGPQSQYAAEGDYIHEGFVPLQNALSASFIKQAAKAAGLVDAVSPDILMQKFPYPPYLDDRMLTLLDILAPFILVLSFLYPVNQIVKQVTSEKENQLKEIMKIMGLTTAHHWTAWFVTIFIWMFVLMIVIVCFLKIPIVKGLAVLTTSSWSLLFVFLLLWSITLITFCFMVSTFFSKATVAGSIAGLLWFAAYVPYTFTTNGFADFSFGVKIIVSLLGNTAMAFGFRTMTRLEAGTRGAQWDNLFDSSVPESLAMGEVLIMFIADAILYMLIALYLEKVKPGPNGVAYKWYFPVTRDYWFPTGTSTYFSDDSQNKSQLDPDRFDLDTSNENKKAGIQVRNLTKTFNGKDAVSNLSLDMYENEITVLLGHNGAGKTTTISIITGFMSATKGRILINGTDISKDMSLARQQLGVCPQHNILFNELTVREHIIFYSQLKGFENNILEAEVTKYLGILDLEDKRDAQSHTLSGGMKRKLSLGVALCGGSKVVLCDEPSSGMDPQARRALWNLLESEKKGRTILLTTHFMDEADVLGDRIAIMSHGELACCGSSFFLKKKFGTGYQVICNKGPDCSSNRVTALMRKYIPDLQVKTDIGTELSYQLSDNYAHLFENLLKDLENSQKELNLNGYGISMATLEDVFMKTGTDMLQSNSENEEIDRNGTSVLVAPPNNNETVDSLKRHGYQWKAMFLKKFIYSYRNWYMILIQLVIPVVLLVFGLLAGSTSFVDLPALPISLNNYKTTTTLLSETDTSKLVESYQEMFRKMRSSDYLITTKKDMQDEILSLGWKSIEFSDSNNYLAGATIAPGPLIAWYNNEALHTAPLSLNLLQNAIAKSILGPDYSISVINKPLPFDTDFKIKQLTSSADVSFQLAVNLTFAMSIVSSIFIMFVIKERESRAKLMQFASGINSGIFWATHLLFDLFIFLLIAICVICTTLAFQQPGFRTGNEMGVILLIILLYGLTSLPFTYLMSHLFSNPTAGLSRLSIINILTGLGLYITMFVLRFTEKETADALEMVFLIFPNFAFADALSNQASSGSWKNICEITSKNNGVTIAELCATTIQQCCNLDPFTWETPGIGKMLLYMSATAVLFIALVLIIERYYTNLRNVKNIFRPPLPPMHSGIDDDVQNEKDRVRTMTANSITDKTLVMRGLTKFYGKFLAVDKLSLSIERGECFGLLGVNGAGKTSAFKMLTGDENISYGDVWIGGYNTKKDMPTIFEMIGYCPQFDALLLDLTGRETLKIFCLIRGIPIHTIDSFIVQLGKDLGFDNHLDKKVMAYSGGNKRKLSTAVALLGNPDIVYLDEPTAGIDPASRRKLWNMVCIIRDLGKGIILTSHSMEECEALCTRIAIMVNGEFQCLGSTQHLKNKFSKGITLTIKMKKPEHDDSMLKIENISQTGDRSSDDLKMDKYERQVYEFVRTTFPSAVLKDNRLRLLTFEIPLNGMPYSKIFGILEAGKMDLNIEDYSLTQATLEQVFLQFAKHQRDEEEKKKKKKKKNKKKVEDNHKLV